MGSWLFHRGKQVMNIRRLLIAGLILSVIYFISSAFSSYPQPKLSQGENKINNEVKVKNNVRKNSIPYNFYLQAIAGKKIFGSFLPAGYSTRTSLSAGEDLKDINLVGIISGLRPQAIIEDKKIQKTYYLAEGESAVGLRVEKIKEKRVVVDYHGQIYELSL